MSLLTLIRHGQATAFQKQSDRLTETGEQQAHRLAAFWLRNGARFDEVYTGTLERQTRTERIVAAHFVDAGAPWPAPVAVEGFNEYDAPGVLMVIVPALAARDPSLAALVRDFENTRENRAFQRMFEVAMFEWARGQVEAPGVEPWPAFRGRVLEALQRVMLTDGSRRIAVFTSGGPIGLGAEAQHGQPQ